MRRTVHFKDSTMGSINWELPTKVCDFIENLPEAKRKVFMQGLEDTLKALVRAMMSAFEFKDPLKSTEYLGELMGNFGAAVERTMMEMLER